MAFSTQHFRDSLPRLELKGHDTYSTPTYFHRTAVLWSGPAVLHGLWGTVIAGTLMLMPPPLIPP